MSLPAKKKASAKREKVVFYFPWREVSGGPYYLTRLANKLAEDPRYEVYYTDYEPGLSDSMLTEKVKKITVSEQCFAVGIDDPYTIVVPIYWACWLPPMHPDCKVVYFNWHICCLPELQNNWRINDDLLVDFLKLAQRTDSCFFCDSSHWMAQNRKNITFAKSIVPISAPAKSRHADPALVKEGEMHLGVLSRLCADKIYSVINLLDNFKKIKTTQRKFLHIVGDGPDKPLIKIEKYPDITIVFHGTVTGDKLDALLTSQVDALFAMGTSVLDGAALRLPSVIMPHNMHPIQCDAFVYVQDTVDYCLGWYDTQMKDLGLKPIKLASIIDDLYGQQRKGERSAQAYDYYLTHHMIDAAVVPFKKALQDSTLTYGEQRAATENFGKNPDRYLGSVLVRLFGKPIIFERATHDHSDRVIAVGRIPVLGVRNDAGRRKYLFIFHRRLARWAWRRLRRGLERLGYGRTAERHRVLEGKLGHVEGKLGYMETQLNEIAFRISSLYSPDHVMHVLEPRLHGAVEAAANRLDTHATLAGLSRALEALSDQVRRQPDLRPAVSGLQSHVGEILKVVRTPAKTDPVLMGVQRTLNSTLDAVKTLPHPETLLPHMQAALDSTLAAIHAQPRHDAELQALQDTLNATLASVQALPAPEPVLPVLLTLQDSLDATKAAIAALPQPQAALQALQTTLDNVATAVHWLRNPSVTTMDTCDKLLSEDSFQQFTGDIRDDYLNLIRGLDEHSVFIVGRILSRIADYRHEHTCYFWFTEFERQELQKIMDQHRSSIVRLADGCFAYGHYLLPRNIITTSILYYEHFLNEVEDLERVRTGAIIDAGGYIGDSALILSKYTDSDVHVFEPVKGSQELTRQTVEMNGLTNVVLRGVALGETTETSVINVKGDTSTLRNTAHLNADTCEQETVSIITLDDYVAEHGIGVSLIKVDVEGFEQPLLLGARKTIETQKPVLLLSIYHSADDFFHIKTVLESWNLGYKFKIRKPSDQSILVDTMLIAEVR